MTGEQFKTTIKMIEENIKNLTDYSINHDADPSSSGLTDLYEAVNGLHRVADSGHYNQIRSAAQLARTRLGYINAMFLPPEADVFLEKTAKGLRELSKTLR